MKFIIVVDKSKRENIHIVLSCKIKKILSRKKMLI